VVDGCAAGYCTFHQICFHVAGPVHPNWALAICAGLHISVGFVSWHVINRYVQANIFRLDL
jgi:hypothetical protein